MSDADTTKALVEAAFAEARKRALDAMGDHFHAWNSLDGPRLTQQALQMAQCSALIDIAAVFAVDCGAELGQMVAILQESMERAGKAAPKFG